MDAVPGTKCKREGIRARSRSMVNGVRKLTRLHSFSGSVPRYVGILKGWGGEYLDPWLQTILPVTGDNSYVAKRGEGGEEEAAGSVVVGRLFKVYSYSPGFMVILWP